MSSRAITLIDRAPERQNEAKGRKLFSCTLVALLLSCASTPADQNVIDLEESVCGLKEPVFFKGWTRAAGKPDSSRLLELDNVEDVSVKTKDTRILRGYKLKGSRLESAGTATGYLLVVQGNAMLADQIIRNFKPFADSGYDVYVFDFRGYGRSEGAPRFKGILSDYSEIIDYLNSLTYSNRVFYGLSFGGVVLLDALKNKPGRKRVVIDSTRSHFSEYGCPKIHDPLNTLPNDCSTFLVIAGLRDQVVTPPASAELLKLARRRGASILKHPEFNHPFMDRDIALHNYRMNAVRTFLLTGERVNRVELPRGAIPADDSTEIREVPGFSRVGGELLVTPPSAAEIHHDNAFATGIGEDQRGLGLYSRWSRSAFCH